VENAFAPNKAISDVDQNTIFYVVDFPPWGEIEQRASLKGRPQWGPIKLNERKSLFDPSVIYIPTDR
jgi:hypothetical protein